MHWKVIEQFKDLVNWPREIRLKGQLEKSRICFRFKEGEREIWLTPWEALDPLAKVITWGILGRKIEEDKEGLPKLRPKAPKSITHELWFSKVWEMQAFDKIKCVKGCS